MSKKHSIYYESRTLSPEDEKRLIAEAQASLARQELIDAENNPSFEEFLRQYFAQN